MEKDTRTKTLTIDRNSLRGEIKKSREDTRRNKTWSARSFSSISRNTDIISEWIKNNLPDSSSAKDKSVSGHIDSNRLSYNDNFRQRRESVLSSDTNVSDVTDELLSLCESELGELSASELNATVTPLEDSSVREQARVKQPKEKAKSRKMAFVNFLNANASDTTLYENNNGKHCEKTSPYPLLNSVLDSARGVFSEEGSVSGRPIQRMPFSRARLANVGKTPVLGRKLGERNKMPSQQSMSSAMVEDIKTIHDYIKLNYNDRFTDYNKLSSKLNQKNAKLVVEMVYRMDEFKDVKSVQEKCVGAIERTYAWSYGKDNQKKGRVVQDNPILELQSLTDETNFLLVDQLKGVSLDADKVPHEMDLDDVSSPTPEQLDVKAWPPVLNPLDLDSISISPECEIVKPGKSFETFAIVPKRADKSLVGEVVDIDDFFESPIRHTTDHDLSGKARAQQSLCTVIDTINELRGGVDTFLYDNKGVCRSPYDSLEVPDSFEPYLDTLIKILNGLRDENAKTMMTMIINSQYDGLNVSGRDLGLTDFYRHYFFGSESQNMVGMMIENIIKVSQDSISQTLIVVPPLDAVRQTTIYIHQIYQFPDRASEYLSLLCRLIAAHVYMLPPALVALCSLDPKIISDIIMNKMYHIDVNSPTQLRIRNA